MKGYLVLAQNTLDVNYIRTVDYIEMAYALALSIKNTQSGVNQFAIAVEEDVDIPKKYMKVFDHVIIIPGKDDAKHSEWKIENQWKYYEMTPFDETVVLDADMIFTSDISYWWDILEQKEMWAPTSVKTYRSEIVSSDYYRKTFTSNNLPNVYIAFLYFKKCDMVKEIFKMMCYLERYWKKFTYGFLDETRPLTFSGDVALALAIKILGVENDCTNVFVPEIPTFVHMKSYIQNIPSEHITEDWTEYIPTYFNNDCQLKIGNFQQILPFHYHVKTWLTEDIINKLEMKYERNRKVT